MSFEEYKIQGNHCYQTGDLETSLQCYNKCIRIEPTNPVAYANKAMALLKLHRYQDALAACHLGLKLKGPEKIRDKLLYRVKLAQSHLSSEAKYVEVSIDEVTTLPLEFRGL
ncbi:hypothetical protein HG535_0A07290 [Zygotorulaspora mrakii]|uniref:Uncharacterized protein n=1 Tax=Zygotorulaspora mrakii TaxID=42260 RepID=A0A7H9AXC4_ZYGMR|nr:uncharacterized protein HG535_0A07290 [Zygotorulaspora mrakii]QLG70787.1 hypothetical protein HG535_0A07290 [Zygotorulaspora mrakii]